MGDMLEGLDFSKWKMLAPPASGVPTVPSLETGVQRDQTSLELQMDLSLPSLT